MTLYEDLQYRGLIKDQAGDDLEKIINGCDATFYWGTDPTADSLTVGHYSSLITAKRLAKYGHHPILLCGGATGLIGDPRPTAEREIISKEKLNKNLEGIRAQVNKIFDGKAEVVNNYDWFKGYEFTDVLRDIGKYITVNYMLDKDIIKRRLETGITFAEFAYMLIQGYDFLWLYENKNCIMQVEGSDQWGNITTGLDLIKKITGEDAYAFTMPLVLDANGNKFGKSEGNALWLDKEKTSSYELYQYLVNTDDKMVETYLKIFTFLTPEEIMDVVKKHEAEQHLRIGQKTLAREIITDLHGKEEYEHALHISEALFSGDIKNLNYGDIMIGFKGVPIINAKENVLIDLLVNNGICSSRREAREFLASGAITINGDKVTDENMPINKDIALNDELLVIRKGKKKYYLVKIA